MMIAANTIKTTRIQGSGCKALYKGADRTYLPEPPVFKET
jgi:hypothetical protein